MSNHLSNSIEKTVLFTEEKVKSGKKYNAIYDKETGEILKDWWVEEHDSPSGRPANKTPHFVKMYRSNWKDIISKKLLTPYEQYLFTSLLAFVKWDTVYAVNPSTKNYMSENDIVKMCGGSRTHIRSVLGSLCKKGFIKRISYGQGKRSRFAVNPNIAYFGNTMLDPAMNTLFDDCAFIPEVPLTYRKTQKK